MIGDNAVKQSCRFLMDKPVIAMVWAGNRRLDCMLTHDSWSAAILKCLFMTADSISPRDAVMWPSD